jgi:hypothetical protein
MTLEETAVIVLATRAPIAKLLMQEARWLQDFSALQRLTKA